MNTSELGNVEINLGQNTIHIPRLAFGKPSKRNRGIITVSEDRKY